MDNIDIFIDTFKDFVPSVISKCYKVTHGNNIVTRAGNLPIIDCVLDEELDDKFYSEIYMYKWLAKNYPLKEYVGTNHYRRYWEFLDKVPDMDELFSKHDVATVARINFKGDIYCQYSVCHNIEDLMIVKNIIHTKFHEYDKVFDGMLGLKWMYPYNMFIMKRDDFLEYVDFVSRVLDEYIKIVGTDILKRIEANKDKYLKPYVPCNTIEYQYRIGGYLGERLTNLYIMKNFTKIKEYNIVKTCKKYNGEPD